MILKSVAEYLKEKSTAVLSFVVFYAICNCRWIFVSLFTSQELIFEKEHLLKNEYLYRSFSELHIDSIWFWMLQIIVPLILTYIWIWWAPKFLINPAYKKQILYANERKKFKAEKEKEALAIESGTIKQEADNTDRLMELNRKKRTIAENNPEILFDEEYNEFISSERNLSALYGLKDIMYSDSGRLSADIDADDRMIWDVNELTKRREGSPGYLDITDKGKYFLKKFASTLNNNSI